MKPNINWFLYQFLLFICYSLVFVFWRFYLRILLPCLLQKSCVSTLSYIWVIYIILAVIGFIVLVCFLISVLISVKILTPLPSICGNASEKCLEALPSFYFSIKWKINIVSARVKHPLIFKAKLKLKLLGNFVRFPLIVHVVLWCLLIMWTSWDKWIPLLCFHVLLQFSTHIIKTVKQRLAFFLSYC